MPNAHSIPVFISPLYFGHHLSGCAKKKKKKPYTLVCRVSHRHILCYSSCMTILQSCWALQYLKMFYAPWGERNGPFGSLTCELHCSAALQALSASWSPPK